MTGDLDWDCDVVDVERKPSAERSTANTVLLSRATTQLLNRPTDRSTQLLGACHGANDDDVMCRQLHEHGRRQLSSLRQQYIDGRELRSMVGQELF